MQSSHSRLISGAVVTSLLLALIALILLTLFRTADSPDRTSQVGVDAGATAQFALAETATAAAGLLQPDTADTPAPALAAATAAPDAEALPADASVDASADTSVDASGEEATASENSAAPELAITIQPTPTRRPAADSGAETPAALAQETPAATAGLPTVDPAAAPSAPLQIFANADAVADMTWLDGALWTATSAGARRWDPASGEVTRYGIDEGLFVIHLRAVTACPLEGLGLVFGGEGGLEVLDVASGEWLRLSASNPGPGSSNAAGLPFDDVTALDCNPEAGLLAVGSATQGIAVLDAATGAWRAISAEADAAETDLRGPVRALAVADNGDIWVASGVTVARVVNGEVETRFDSDNSPLTGESVTTVETDGDVLWATAGDRLYRYAEAEWSVFRSVNADGEFPAGTLVALQPAAGGRAWIASQSGEICRFDPARAACTPWYAGQEGMATASLTALASSADGQLAFGTAGGGSSVLQRGVWSTLAEGASFPASNRIFALATDTRGYLWSASSGGVQQANPGAPTEVTLHSADQGMLASNVRVLLADSAGGVWLGGSGAAHFDGVAWTNYAQSEGLVDEEITSITQDSQARVWFGTRAGLSIWTGSAFFNLTAENGLPDAEILSLAADTNSVWIGSANGGLYRFENNQLQVLTQENVGLPSNRILALLVAPDRSLYVGTDAGMVRFARGEFNPVPGMPADEITSLALGSGGVILAGSATQGTWMLAADATSATPWVRLQSNAGALPASVRALAIDLYNDVWLGTDGGGLTRFSLD